MKNGFMIIFLIAVVFIGGIAILDKITGGQEKRDKKTDAHFNEMQKIKKDRDDARWKRESEANCANDLRTKEESDNFLAYLKERNLDVVTACRVDGHNLKINIDNYFFTKPYQSRLQIVQSFFVVFVQYKNSSPEICKLTVCDPMGNEVGGYKNGKAWVKNQ